MNQPRLLETWHDALQIREEALDLFGLGSASTCAPVPRSSKAILVRGSRSERNRLRHEACTRRTSEKIAKLSARQVLLQLLPVPVAARFVGDRPDFSRSCPSAGSTKRPDRSATLQDITCDSDGKIDNFISYARIANYAPCRYMRSTPRSRTISAYSWSGAYQEILGDYAQPLRRHECRARQRVQRPLRDRPSHRRRDGGRSPRLRAVQSQEDWFAAWKHGLRPR